MEIDLIIDGCFVLVIVIGSVLISIVPFAALSWFLFAIGAIT